MRRSAVMPKAQQLILNCLARVQFATNKQLAKMCDIDPRRVSESVQTLLGLGLIDGSLLTRPMILHLTPAAGRLLDEPLPVGRRHVSWSVMAHGCHKNAAAEVLLKEHTGFYFLSRLDLLKQGFNPAYGEHGALDAAGNTYFVLLDDYLMPPDRIRRSWTRRHAPNKKYWADPTGRVWGDVAQRFLLVCTDEQHLERHRVWIEKQQLPADLIYIQPLWKT